MEIELKTLMMMFSIGSRDNWNQRKPSLPIGEIGRDAFGKIPSFEDKGIRNVW